MDWATLWVNVSGAFLLGTFTGLAGRGTLSSQALVIAGTGFCGSFTTFATVGVAAVASADAGRPRRAATDVGLNLALGLAAAGIGLWIGA